MLKQAESDEEAEGLVSKWFQSRAAHVLSLKKESELDVLQPVHTYDMDSLVAIDAKNWFGREIGVDVQVVHLLGNKSLETVAREAATASRFRSSE